MSHKRLVDGDLVANILGGMLKDLMAEKAPTLYISDISLPSESPDAKSYQDCSFIIRKRNAGMHECYVSVDLTTGSIQVKTFDRNESNGKWSHVNSVMDAVLLCNQHLAEITERSAE